MYEPRQRAEALASNGFGEFRENWRPLLGCFLGVGSALALNPYIMSTFAPYLIEEFHWSRSQWALLGIVQLAMLVCLPLVGRLADTVGVRPIVAVGAIVFPVSLFALANTNGDLRIFFAIYTAQTVLCATTSMTVYSRLIIASFDRNRGLALGMAGMGAAMITAIGGPLVTQFIAGHGWRAGYMAVAVFCALCSIVTLYLISGAQAPARRPATAATSPRDPSPRFAGLPAFWVILAATFLVSLPFALAAAQLKLVVLEQGLSDATAAMMVSTFALASIAGRFVSGAALDRLPVPLVAAVTFWLPAAGLLVLASDWNGVVPVALAIGLVGLAFGAEGDVVPVLVSRYVGLSSYGAALGVMFAAIGGAMALGNMLLELTLDAAGSFGPFLLLAAAFSFAGGALFLTLRACAEAKLNLSGAETAAC